MPRRERISSVDTAWLRMDSPGNLMMIVGVMVFDGPLDVQRLRDAISARMLKFPRFRQRAVEEITGAFWEDDADFDLDSHLSRIALPGQADKAELERMVGELASTPLDSARPRWHFHVVENYDGGAALIVRIHHCIADGIALIGVLLSLTDESADAPSPDGTAAPLATREPQDDGLAFLRQVVEPLGEATAAAWRLGGTVWTQFWRAMQDPQQITDVARLSADVAAEAALLAAMPNDTPTCFKGRPGALKRVAWSEPLPLAEVKALGKALGCSVNDVLLSCVAGALRHYLASRGESIDGVEVRALVPVNLRADALEPSLGNHFGLVALLLPVGLEHPLERLYEVRRRMNQLKGSHQALLTFGLLGMLGLCPRPLQTMVLDILARKATAVMTNVPGPQQALYLAGARLAQTMFWVPQSGDICMGVSILSYAGSVQFGVITDRKLVPDPQGIVDRFQPEFEKALLLTLMEAWEEPPACVAHHPAEAPPSAAKRAPRRRAPARAAHSPRGSAPRETAHAAEPPAAATDPPAPGPARVPKRFR
ncbi:MAG: wax ester/triacylglycerol synthase family O-acyltransferase [Betaproteobacteria bacterium]|nr:wax ester/triacylglycerol synthase family O-acyltransferase [Betaproteobacteria bacterium]